MERADGQRIAEAELVKLVGRGLAPLVVRLVHHQHQPLGRHAQHLRHVSIGGRHSVNGIHHHDDHVGIGDGNLDLPLHLAPEVSLRKDLEAARIHQDEGVIRPDRLGRHAVAGGARYLGYDCDPPACHAVEQRGLANVGPSDDRHQRFDHSLGTPSNHSA